MTMDFYLDRDEQRALRDKLNLIPGLIEDLAITVTRQARITRPGLNNNLCRTKPEPRLPFHFAAAKASDDLNTELVKWVRFTCTNRQVHYTEREDTMPLARWLRNNLIGLALTPGSETAAADIAYRIDECRKHIDLPPEDEIHIDPTRVRQANRQIVTAGQVDKIAAKLGHLGTGLNKRRVETLDKGGALKPCAIDDGVKFYRLGDVLDAHHRHARRARKVAGRTA